MTTTDSPLQHQAQDAEGLRAEIERLIRIAMQEEMIGSGCHDRVRYRAKFAAKTAGDILGLLSASPPQAETPGLDREAMHEALVGVGIEAIVEKNLSFSERYAYSSAPTLLVHGLPEACNEIIEAILAATAVSQPPTNRQGAGEVEALRAMTARAEGAERALQRLAEDIGRPSAAGTTDWLPISKAKKVEGTWIWCLQACAGFGWQPNVAVWSIRDNECGWAENGIIKPVSEEMTWLNPRWFKPIGKLPPYPHVTTVYPDDDASDDAVPDAEAAVLPAQPGPAPVVEGDAIETIARALYAEMDGELTWETEGEHIREHFRAGARAALDSIPAAGGTDAARDVLAERRRQVEAEGWTPEHDDQHNERELGLAAACYASAVSPTYLDPKWSSPRAVRLWPWDDAWWKPSSYRRNLVKAGALILAEIERLDRVGVPAAPTQTARDGGE